MVSKRCYFKSDIGCVYLFLITHIQLHRRSHARKYFPFSLTSIFIKMNSRGKHPDG